MLLTEVIAGKTCFTRLEHLRYAWALIDSLKATYWLLSQEGVPVDVRTFQLTLLGKVDRDLSAWGVPGG
jgi:hypothetical protein